MKRSKPTTLRLGTISEGTLRPEDLIPAYLSALDGIRLSKAERKTVRDVRYEWERSAVDYDGADELIEDLTNIIDAHCPDYAYFGTSEGDGACFGVWADIASAQEDARGNPRNIITNDGPDDDGGFPGAAKSRGLDYFLRVNDHGNATLYRRAGNRWIEVWSVV